MALVLGAVMASSDVQRKLTAILSADVQGYSRLMGDDEAATVETITAYRKIFFRYVKEYRGRIVNAPGDSILAEFGSVVDAVEGAAEIQRELAERNAELVEERKMLFRIGVNQGDVIVRGEELYGDAVNIAARSSLSSERSDRLPKSVGIPASAVGISVCACAGSAPPGTGTRGSRMTKSTGNLPPANRGKPEGFA